MTHPGSKHLRLVLLLTTLLLLQSCASIFNGTSERITVSSDVKDTKFYLNGTDQVATNSGSFLVPKNKLKETVITAKKEGCSDTSTHIDTSFDATTLLGIFIDYGIISILIVDMGINGAVNKAARKNYVLTPQC